MIRLEVETNKAQRFLKAKADKTRDARVPLRKVQAYIIVRIGLQFARLRKGGHFRGVFWADLRGRPHARQRPGISTRGGAFGGYREGVYSEVSTRKIRGGTITTDASTLGVMRPSGKRVTADSAVMVDIGTMLRKAGKWIKRITNNEIVFGENLSYAAKQDKARPFMFFELPRDLNEARRIVKEYFER